MDQQKSVDLAVKVHRLMMLAFTKGLRPNAVMMPSQLLARVKAEGESIVGKIPEGWVVEYMGLRVIEVSEEMPVSVAVLVWENDTDDLMRGVRP